MYNLNPKGTVTIGNAKIPVILCHIDSYNYGMGSAHSDVLHWFKKHGKTMTDVRNDVQKIINDYKKELKKVNKKKPTSYVVKVTANKLNVRKKPDIKSKVTMTVKKGEAFTIIKEKNGFGKLKSGKGWISLSWVKKV